MRAAYTRRGNVSSTIKRVLLSNWRLEKVYRFSPPSLFSHRFPEQHCSDYDDEDNAAIRRRLPLPQERIFILIKFVYNTILL